MTPQDALADGRLADAVALQDEVVRQRPDDPAVRLFLFELLTLAGRLADARDHLRAIESADPAWPATRKAFARLLKAEYRRSHRHRRPTFLSPPPAHAARRWRAARAVATGDPDAARWVDSADASSPHLFGHIDGREFDGLRDTDDRFGSVLEVFAGADYAWIPFADLRRITLSPAVAVLDVAFRVARLTWVEGTAREFVLPLLYPGSHAAGDGFATGQEADWPEAPGGVVCGIGPRVFMVGEEEVLFGDCRQFDLRVAT
ncbi:type VI secretion system accessory protein TagJ [Fimbriiglobus ruber]|uniref:Protein of avirulence locus ImpE n=1 Tax=Fimbriiglobus ruber TaxID=1908690 RepID=A0A225DZX0_9BACT|nr:type VI secretion system accessory protein TagJ [Fimbriiglobus ruber]OWK46891.1 Protein of avirulence locus ImpE [Fimbriiglobus ruber]